MFLVLGGTGELGQAVVEELVQRTVSFKATYHKTNPPKKLNDFFIKLDFDSKLFSQMKCLLKEHDVKVLINCAVVPHGTSEDPQRVSCGVVDKTLEIAKACEEENVRFLQLSTDLVFDGEKGNYNEDDPANPIMHYGACKLEMEKQLNALADLNSIILRTSLILTLEPSLETLLGRNPRRSKAFRFCMQRMHEFSNHKQIADFFVDEWRSMTFSHSLAKAIVSLGALDDTAFTKLCKATPILRLTAPASMTRYELAIKLLEYFKTELDHFDIEPKIAEGRSAIIFKGKRPLDCSLNVTRYEKLSREYSLPSLPSAKSVLENAIRENLGK